MGISDLTKKYNLNEIVKGDAIFSATAITDTMSMKGIVKKDEFTFDTQTLVTYKTSNKNYTNIEKREVTSKYV